MGLISLYGSGLSFAMHWLKVNRFIAKYFGLIAMWLKVVGGLLYLSMKLTAGLL